jgi:hypothetical protein
MKIPDVGERGTPGYRREWQESFRPRRLVIVWLLVFGEASLRRNQENLCPANDG